MPLIKEFSTASGVRAAIWKAEEPESFFSEQTGLRSDKKNDLKRLEHLAGRFLLKHLHPALDYGQLLISPLGKPYLADQSLHFSITHSFPYIGVSIDTRKETGIDVQTLQERIQRIQYKFLSEAEQQLCGNETGKITLAWAAKEAAFKRYGLGAVDFIRHMPITDIQFRENEALLKMDFSRETELQPLELVGGIEMDFAWSVTL